MPDKLSSSAEATRLGGELAEEAWIDVIRRMDQVYTELVQSQETLEAKHRELADAHRFTEGVLEAMTDVMVVCDTLGQVRQVNRAMVSLTGLSENLLTACKLTDLVPGEAERELLLQRLAAGNAEGSDIEIALIAHNGEAIPVTWNVSALYDGERRYSGFVAVGRPVGELKKAYAELKQAHEALKAAQAQLVQAEKMASLGRLVAGVAHELNNPISFLLGNVSALRKYADRLEQYLATVHAGPLPPELAALRQRLRIDAALADLPSVIDGMTEGAHRTADIVNALKRFSVIDRVERGPVDLGQVVEQAIHWVRKGAAPDFRIDWTPPTEPVRVMGSAGQLLQVMLNLIQNAADACAGRPEGRLRITLEPPAWAGGRLRLRFADNGPGVDESQLPHIFTAFYRADSSAHKPGTGLGLALTKHIVGQHGGKIIAENLQPNGLRMRISLPKTKPLKGLEAKEAKNAEAKEKETEPEQ